MSVDARSETTTEAGQAPPGRTVLLLAVACGLTVANLYYAQPLLAGLRDAFHVGDVAAGSLVTVTQIGYAAGMVLLVPLGDRFETRRLVSVMLGVVTAALVVAGTAAYFPVLLAAALVIGAMSVVAQILVPFAANLAPDHRRGRVVGQVMSGLLAGILLSRTAGSLIAEVAGWRVVYLASAAFMAVLAVALRSALPSRAPTTHEPYGRLLRSTGRLLRVHAPLRRRALFQAALFGAFSAYWTTVSYVLTGAPFHYSELGVGLFALVGAGGAMIAPAAGRWADRGLNRPMTAVAYGMGVLAFVVGGLGRDHVLLLAAAAVLVDMAVQGSFILGQHSVHALDPEARARINSSYLATIFLGGALGSQLGAYAYHSGGWPAVTVAGGTLPLLALLAWTVTEARSPRAR
ncbi:MFS transporter [Actinomadura sp. B10D3]|uniref:MFS transporter n=1 Tax=Actinomadura sp. B10D3 TaxID=3153557 RepID=UPI00325F3A0F